MILIKKSNLLNLLFSIVLTLLLLTIFILLYSEKVLHWFLIPLFFLSTLISFDIVKWLRNELDFLDPRAILAFLALHFFVIAPLLHVSWDYWLAGIYPPNLPSDWRPWLGYMAILNFIGYMIYIVFRVLFIKRLSRIKIKAYSLNKRRFFLWGIIFLIVTFITQTIVYISYGGVMGFIEAYSNRDSFQSNFNNMGVIFMISESFPIIFLMLIIVILNPIKIQKNESKKISFILITIILILFVLERLYFGGLRGSRSNTIWAVFWAIGIIHFTIRRFSKKALIPIGIFFLAFMTIYGVYKSEGINFANTIEDIGLQSAISENDRGFERILLVDLARSDIQAFELYKLVKYNDYNLALGQTYLNAVSIIIPDSINPFNFESKVSAGTDIQYGENTYSSGARSSSRIYGLAGEFMLNFGYVFVPLAFIILSILVAISVVLYRKLENWDPRKMLLPFIILLSFLTLVNDMDNIIFLLVKNLSIPFFLIYMSRRYVKITEEN